MIQDLDSVFDNQYSHKKPLEESRIIFSKGKLLLVLEGRQNQEHNEYNESQTGWNDHEIPKVSLLFPLYEEVKAYVKDPIYLFSVDGQGFYWQSLNQKTVDSERIAEELCGKLSREAWEAKLVVAHLFRAAETKEMAMAGMVASQLINWYQANHYCGACGNSLELGESERMLRCKSCGNVVFPRINPAVIVAITNGDKLLLTRYRGRGYKNYALVAGFVEMGESVEQTVAREVMEETGLKVKNIQYYKSQPWGFADNILMGYSCELDGSDEITMDREELAVAEWVNRSDIKEINQDMSLTNEMICAFAKGDLTKQEN